MKIEIPKKLRRKDIKFIRLAPKKKIPIDKEWNTNPKYWFDFDDKELLEHLEDGGNYGVLGGEGELIIVDSDNPKLTKYIEENLPKTFTGLTGSNLPYKKHFYFKSNDVTSIVLKKINKKGKEEHFGEIQGRGKQVVGISCIHPDTGDTYKLSENINITTIKEKDLEKLKEKFCTKELLRAKKNKQPIKKFEDEDIENNLNVINIIDSTQLKKKNNSGYYFGSHPVHGSKTGQNFHIDSEENVWYCFRCGSGGGVASLIAVKEGLINCSEAKSKLKRDVYKKALKLAEIKYGYVNKKEENVSNENIVGEGSESWYRYLAKNFIDEYPIFYDKARLWWLWDFENYCWIKTDEVDIMNLFDKKYIMSTEKQEIKSRILEALKKKGRLNTPKEPLKNWIQFKNKIVDVETNKIFESTPEYFVTNPIPWEIGESEETPTIDRLFTEWVIGNTQFGTYQDKSYTETLKEICAYCCLSNMPIHRIFCLVGGGGNGKSSFLRLIEKFLGNENVGSSKLSLLLSDSQRFETIQLFRKLVVLIGEVSQSTLKQTDELKRITGDDLVRIEFKNKDPFKFRSYAKPISAVNKMPPTPDKSTGFYRRWLIIDFPNEFEEKEKEITLTIPDWEFKNLAKKSIRILKELLKRGKFTNDGKPNEKEAKYETRSTSIIDFIKEHCEEDPDSKIPLKLFCNRFNNYLRDKKVPTLSNKEISKNLKNLKYEIKTTSKKIDERFTTEQTIIGLKGEFENENQWYVN